MFTHNVNLKRSKQTVGNRNYYRTNYNGKQADDYVHVITRVINVIRSLRAPILSYSVFVEAL